MQFMVELDAIANGRETSLEIEHLTSVGKGVIELKINGRPAYRCVYTTKIPGKVVVLHAFKKTKNGPDGHNLDVVRQRLKGL
jgi:phage-related protein